jgi:proton glutamate symport protein
VCGNITQHDVAMREWKGFREDQLPAKRDTQATRTISTTLLIAGVALLSVGAIVPLATRGSAFEGGGFLWPALRIAGLVVLAALAVQRRSLTSWIFWSMLAGVELGLDAPGVSAHLHVLSDVFLRLIKMIVAPLIFGTLVTGISGHGEMRGLGRLGLKSLIFFEILTTLALAVGLVAINISRAGVGLANNAVSSTGQAGTPAGQNAPNAPTPPASLSWDQFLLHAVPENIAKAVAENQILQVAVFAVLFGMALIQVKETARAPMLRLAESLTETMFALTNLVMYFAPVGVGAALAFTVGHLGLGVMVNLGKLLLTLYVALIAFSLLVMLPCLWLTRIPLRRFLAAVAEPVTIAFATSTSEAALPRAMEEMEAFGVPRRIVAFVLPAGYSFNLTGSGLYLSLTAIFVAQAAGIPMSWSQQIFMLLALMVTSKGIAGIPRAGFVVLLATASTFHLPEWPVFVVFGVDALMDMGRTAVNVAGNCLAAAVVAQWEGELDSEAPSELAVAALED